MFCIGFQSAVVDTIWTLSPSTDLTAGDRQEGEGQWSHFFPVLQVEGLFSESTWSDIDKFLLGKYGSIKLLMNLNC